VQSRATGISTENNGGGCRGIFRSRGKRRAARKLVSSGSVQKKEDLCSIREEHVANKERGEVESMLSESPWEKIRSYKIRY